MLKDLTTRMGRSFFLFSFKPPAVSLYVGGGMVVMPFPFHLSFLFFFRSLFPIFTSGPDGSKPSFNLNETGHQRICSVKLTSLFSPLPYFGMPFHLGAQVQATEVGVFKSRKYLYKNRVQDHPTILSHDEI